VFELRSFRWFSDFFNFTDIDDDTTKSFYKEFRHNPHNIWIGNLLANIEFQKGDYRKANRIFQQLAEIEGDSADFFNNIGVTYIMMGEEEKGCMLLAEEAFKRAISLDRFYPEYLFNLANLYYRMNRFEEAYINIIKAMTLEKNFPGVKELHDYIVKTIEKKRAEPEKYKPLLSEDSLKKGDKEKEKQETILEYFKWKD
jgi:tetratricopeptide (TPR) repeat protein